MDKLEGSFAEWKAACLTAAQNFELAVDDMWASDDPYDLADAAKEAFEEGQDPNDFIAEMFEEDLARQEYDNDLRSQSEEQFDEPDFDDEDPGDYDS